MRPMKVSKVDAASRQPDTAISLWFRDDDPVSIHTLAFAAYEIAQKLSQKLGNLRMTLEGWVPERVKPESVQAVIQRITEARNFFKHADRDPYGILDFDPSVTEYVLVLCVVCLANLRVERSDWQSTLVLWHFLHRPELFLPGANPFPKAFGPDQIAELGRMHKPAFAQFALNWFAQHVARR
jgi:hypothetical protein